MTSISSAIRVARARIRGFFGGAPPANDVADEMAAHLTMAIDENIRRGMSPGAARRAALIKTGGIASAREAYRDQQSIPALEAIRADVVFALRSFRKTPGVALTIVLTLGLAIGASTTMFSIVHGVLLNPLPLGNADRLVWTVNHGKRPYDAISPGDYRDWGAMNSSFEATASWVHSQAGLDGAGTPIQLSISDVTDNWFTVLGVPMQRGRGFVAGEEGYGKAKIAILSDGLWRAQFGADPAAVGRTILLDGTRYTIVGVAPARFDFPQQTQLWRPLAFAPQFASTRNSRGLLGPVALLKRGVTFERARTEARGVAARLHALYPESETGLDYDIQPLHEHFVGDTRKPLVVLLAAVTCLLLIACANVATLLLTRSAARATEIGVRMALGAGKRRIAVQLLTESVMLALSGGALGVAVAAWATHAVVASHIGSIPALADVSIDLRVLAVSLFVTMTAGVLFGMAPALQAARTDIVDALKSGARGTSGSKRAGRTRGVLLIAEVALVVPLLIGASLLVQSFSKLVSQSVGFNADHVIRFDLSLPICGTTWAPDSTCAGVRDPRYTSKAQIQTFSHTLIAGLRSMPGTVNAAIGFGVPFTGFAQNQGFVAIKGEPLPPPDRPNMVEQKYVTPGYFATMGIPIVRGRDFTDGDRIGGAPVAIVSEGAVKAYFGGVDPIGKELQYQGTVIGVVGDTKTQGLSGTPEPALYQSLDQFPINWMTVVVHSTADPATAMTAALAQLSTIDRTLPAEHVGLMRHDVDASASSTRIATLILSGFAAAALLLATLGIYGLIAYTVRARQREVGIRVALGASGAHVVALVVRGGVTLVVAGVGVGVVLSLVASQAIRGLVFGVAPTDPVTYVVTITALLGVAAVASWLPARRATQIDPLIAMRPE